ncbi:MAG: cupin domain-containing protein [Acidobacteriaceae bacterium]
MFARRLVFTVIAAMCVPLFHAQERRIDPTWLHRNTFTAPEKPSDITTPTCHYKPLFGQGDADTSIVVGVARYGEAIVDPHGSCAAVQYPGEDQVYVVLSGSGSADYANQQVPLKTEDYLYIPSTVRHALKNGSAKPLVVVIMGFRTRGFETVAAPKTPQKANIEDVPFEFVSGHPESARYRLLMGDVNSKRDRIAAGRVLTSLFLMEIAPNGTNFPHHHEREEEIYLILSGHGTIVAGGGMDGVAGRHPAKAGDAYFFRLNATVGYYSAPGVSSRLLCVRSWYPGMVKKGMQH